MAAVTLDICIERLTLHVDIGSDLHGQLFIHWVIQESLDLVLGAIDMLLENRIVEVLGLSHGVVLGLLRLEEIAEVLDIIRRHLAASAMRNQIYELRLINGLCVVHLLYVHAESVDALVVVRKAFS